MTELISLFVLRVASVSDRIGDREHTDPNVHIDRPMVRDMLPTAVQVHDGPSENSDHRYLGDSAAVW